MQARRIYMYKWLRLLRDVSCHQIAHQQNSWLNAGTAFHIQQLHSCKHKNSTVWLLLIRHVMDQSEFGSSNNSKRKKHPTHPYKNMSQPKVITPQQVKLSIAPTRNSSSSFSYQQSGVENINHKRKEAHTKPNLLLPLKSVGGKWKVLGGGGSLPCPPPPPPRCPLRSSWELAELAENLSSSKGGWLLGLMGLAPCCWRRGSRFLTWPVTRDTSSFASRSALRLRYSWKICSLLAFSSAFRWSAISCFCLVVKEG